MRRTGVAADAHVCALDVFRVLAMKTCADLALMWSLQAPEQELELPEDMALDGDQGDEEGAEGEEDDAGTGQHDDAMQQAFPDGADKEEIPPENGEEQQADTDAPEGPPEEGGYRGSLIIAVLCMIIGRLQLC